MSDPGNIERDQRNRQITEQKRVLSAIKNNQTIWPIVNSTVTAVPSNTPIPATEALNRLEVPSNTSIPATEALNRLELPSNTSIPATEASNNLKMTPESTNATNNPPIAHIIVVSIVSSLLVLFIICIVMYVHYKRKNKRKSSVFGTKSEMSYSVQSVATLRSIYTIKKTFAKRLDTDRLETGIIPSHIAFYDN